VHGAARAGKTTFAVTGPYPRLILDVERGSRFIENTKRYWDPLAEAPPVADGTWDTCVVRVESFDTVLKAYEWLKSGQHQFKTVIVDSISELQDKCKEQIVGRNKMQTQDWGTMLQRMGFFCRDLRDLTEAPGQPIEAIVVIAMTILKDGIYKPYLQGQLATQIPYWYDVTSYLYTDQVADDNGNLHEVRKLLVGKHPSYETGSRVRNLPMVIDGPNIEHILNGIWPAAEVPIAPQS
jgi:hypothetical protein